MWRRCCGPRLGLCSPRGALAASSHRAQRQHWLKSLDRHFSVSTTTRSRLLRQVAEDIREVGDFDRVAPRVVAQIEAALHPEFVALAGPRAERAALSVPRRGAAGVSPSRCASTASWSRCCASSASRSRSRADRRKADTAAAPGGTRGPARQRRIDLLVPIVTNPERAESVLTLGVKRSEEPYTREDFDLLAVIAANLALLLERSAPPPLRVNETFDECPNAAPATDSRHRRMRARRARARAVRLLAGARDALPGWIGGSAAAASARCIRGSTRRSIDSVAVKMIRDDLLTDPTSRRRFQRRGPAGRRVRAPERGHGLRLRR